MDLDVTQRTALGIAILSISILIGHTLEKRRGINPAVAQSDSRSNTVQGPSVAAFESPRSEPASPTSAPERAHPRVKSGPLTGFNDGQRFLLKRELSAYSGNKIRLVMVGNDPQLGIEFEQLIDIFQDSGWEVQTVRIATVSILGANFPPVPYLTGPNMAAPILANVFSVFSSAGIDLPLTPAAFIGPSGPPDVVIVVHGH